MSDAGIFREFHATIVSVDDLEKSARWYEDVFELKPVRTLPGVMTVYGTGGATHLCIYKSEHDKPGYQGGGAFPNFRTDDLDQTRELLRSRGVECSEIMGSEQVRAFSCFDPDHNRIDICEYGPDWLA